jgi:hypothetical protein
VKSADSGVKDEHDVFIESRWEYIIWNYEYKMCLQRHW